MEDVSTFITCGYAGVKQVKARDRCEIYLHNICTVCRCYRAV